MLTQLKGGNLDCTSRVICACWYQILRFFNFGGHFYYSNFLRSSNESALRFFDFALFHGFFQVLSLFVTFPRFFQGFMYPGSWKLEKIEASDCCKVSCTQGDKTWKKPWNRAKSKKRRALSLLKRKKLEYLIKVPSKVQKSQYLISSSEGIKYSKQE